jgi:PAP2 superfamily
VLYIASLVAWSAHYGIPVQRELVVLWICGALACASLGRAPRRILQLVLDWLPLVLVLAAYDFTRGAADSLGVGVHTRPMIDFDRFVFFGDTPTQWLQAHVAKPGVLTWWDVAFTLIYTSYFIVPFAVAGALWIRDRLGFRRFANRIVSLAAAGLVTYVAFPAAPPWMASEHGLIGPVQRLIPQLWTWSGIGAETGVVGTGYRYANDVAAVPSLHAALALLVALAVWPRRRWAQLLVAAYPLAMALAVVYTGEHYVADVLLGWVYAVGSFLAVRWAVARLRRPSAVLARDVATDR